MDSSQPPEPRLPKLLQVGLLSFDMIGFLSWCQRRLGDCFAIHAPPAGRLVYLADPAEIKRIFTGDPKQFHAGDANAVVLEPVLGRHSLLTLDEEDHLEERKLLLPHFHGESVQRYAETMARLAAAEVDKWEPGASVAIRPAMQRIGLETILHAVLGVTDPQRLARLRHLLPLTTGLSPVIQAMWLWPRLGRFGPWKRYRRTLAETDTLLYEEIAARRKDPSGDDILSLLVASGSLSDAQLRDELMTLLVAGHESTATALAWAFERLVRHPAAMARAATGDDDYLDAVVKETLRLRPVLQVGRTVTRETEAGGYLLPAGTVVLPAVALVQRAAHHYGEDALRFRPERFLDGSPAPYTWIPFGGGVRRCIGVSLATLQMKVVLKEVLARVELAPARPGDEGARVRGVLMMPSRDGEVVVRRRLGAVNVPPVQEPPEPRLPKLAQFILIWYRPIPFLDWCQRRLGDCFAIHAPPFGKLVYVADPAEIKRIYTGDPVLFHAGEANKTVLEPVLGKHSLLVLDEDEHLRERRLLLPHFHGESVRRYADTMATVAAAEVDTWTVGQRILLRPAMQRIGLETILRAVIGVSDPGRLASLRRLLPQVAAVTPVNQAMWTWPWLGRFGPWKRYKETLAAADAVLHEEIAAQRRDPSGESILSLLIADGGLTDAQLRDEVLTMLLGGHDTTATGLAWAFERLVRHPDALARAASGDDAYLDAVAKETLRLRPVLADPGRTVTSDAEVAGYRIPAGTMVLPARGLVQRAARHYGDDSLEFRPERFLEGSPPSYTWIAFGGGRRRCIGAAFAALEMKVVLREVLARVELAPTRPEDEKTRMQGVMMLPGRGGEVVVRRRLERASDPGLMSAAAS